MQALRLALVSSSMSLLELGLNRGSSGNISTRCEGGFLVTPSAMPPEAMKPEDMVFMDFAGNVISGERPSSEWRFHRDILQSRPEFGAVVHVHSPFATTLACLGMEIPPFHYMIAAAGGHTIRCAPYALFGT